MVKWSFGSSRPMDKLLLLRSGAIVIQLITVFAVYFLMALDISLMPLIVVICGETIFHLASILFYRKRHIRQHDLVLQLLADVVFLTLLLSLSGGATNAFVSLLLLPIVIAAVTLPTRWLVLVSVAAMAAYSIMLLKMPSHSMHHMDMTKHFIAMWANFILSALVVTLVVGALARMIIEREQAIAKQREEQLRSEQLLSLGMASTQVTHQLATPLATIQLLYDELLETDPTNPAVQDMAGPLRTCATQLASFRELASAVRDKKPQRLVVSALVAQLQEQFQLQFPLQQLHVNPVPDGYIEADALLLPALFNLLQNAVQANQNQGQHQVNIDFKVHTIQSDTRLHITIRDFGSGVSDHQAIKLGEQLIESEQGLGMALLLSNATIERFSGKLSLINHPDKGMQAIVELPLCSEPQQVSS